MVDSNNKVLTIDGRRRKEEKAIVLSWKRNRMKKRDSGSHGHAGFRCKHLNCSPVCQWNVEDGVPM